MKKNTIFYSIFKTFTLILVISLLLTTIVHIFIETPRMRKQIFSSLEQTCENTNYIIDTEIAQMKTIALNISYSTLVEKQFSKYLSEQNNYVDDQVFGDLLTAIIGPNRPIDQIYLYSTSGAFYASGQFSSDEFEKPIPEEWEYFIMNPSWVKYVYSSGYDEFISKYKTNQFGKNFISFVMKYYDKYSRTDGFIEIKSSYSRVLGSANNQESTYGEEIYIFDKDGNQIFPIQEENHSTLFKTAKDNGFSKVVQPDKKFFSNYFYTCSVSKESGFVTIVKIDTINTITQQITYLATIILVALLTICFAVCVIYSKTKKITDPLNSICYNVSTFDIKNKNYTPQTIDTNIIELNTLDDSFNDMQEKLKDSINHQLTLQNQKMQSHMLALQSQMNPHFLYNSLSSIQSMADENMNKEIIHMCQSMSNILRYISSNKSSTVPVHQEIKYTKDFLECMVIRYQGKLSYSVTIGEGSENIKIPKLAVQQLVENAIKFTTTKLPPYHVAIKSKFDSDSNSFTVKISDNGPGFSSEAIQHLTAEISKINETNTLPSLEINGMGVLNVYIRLKLMFGDDLIFEIKNNKIGGATVTIGGKIHE